MSLQAEQADMGREQKVDPVTLAVVQNALRQVANEMDLVQVKTSFSPIVSEALDRANGIYRPDTGEVITQGETGLPIFVGAMQSTTRGVIDTIGDRLEPGDVVIVNDPYLGGSHLMDVKLVAPFHYKGKLWCFLSNAAHWADIGGAVPGGFTTNATEIHKEGLRITPIKLVSRGVLREDILDLVMANVRVPEERIGDVRAQLGAIKVGANRLTELLDRYGEKTVRDVIEELDIRSEKQMRHHIRQVPDGTYDFTSYLDSDGVVEGKLAITLSMTVSGSDIAFDLSRSSPPCKGPMNSVWAQTQTAIYVGLKHVFPDVPVNAGCFRPVSVEKPLGTFLHAEYPRPVAGCASEVSQRIMEAVFGAMGKAIPDRMFAAPFGTAGNFSLGGYDPETRRHYVMYFFSGGGYGGNMQTDGLSNGASSIGIARTTPIELLEQRYPILIEEYALRPDSGGAGRHRGGLGCVFQCKLLRGEGIASFLMDHALTGPHGLAGGEPGGRTEIVITNSGKVSRLPHLSKGEGLSMQAGDSIRVLSPGGGGYGDAAERSPQLIARDMQREYMSKAQVTRHYGKQKSEEALAQLTDKNPGNRKAEPGSHKRQ